MMNSRGSTNLTSRIDYLFLFLRLAIPVRMIPRKIWLLVTFTVSFCALWVFYASAFKSERTVTEHKSHYSNNKILQDGRTKSSNIMIDKSELPKHLKHQYNDSVSSHPSELLKINDIPDAKVHEISCVELFHGNKAKRLKAAKFYADESKPRISTEELLQMTQNCEIFIKKRQYIMKPVSKQEFHFPIAYSILIFKDIDQFERLLRAIYRPQNFYCIHVEKNSPDLFKVASKAIADCFSNVFIAPVSISVTWGTYSVLEPELICMEELWKRSKKWKYFINLTGQEFPLKTNGDLVKILTEYNGANNMEGTILRQSSQLQNYLHDAPFEMKVTKGSVHITASRGFVDYVLHNTTALEFRKWVQEIPVPDELFFSSLNYNPHLGVPGSYKGIPETDKRNNLFITRFKNWGTWPFAWECAGTWVRQICIFGVGDLPLLASRPELFANKFYVDYQPLALDCMEELHFNRTRDEVLGRRMLDLGFYRNLDFVQNHI